MTDENPRLYKMKFSKFLFLALQSELTDLRKPVLSNPGEERGTVKSISLKFLICVSVEFQPMEGSRERDCLSLPSLLFSPYSCSIVHALHSSPWLGLRAV